MARTLHFFPSTLSAAPLAAMITDWRKRPVIKTSLFASIYKLLSYFWWKRKWFQNQCFTQRYVSDHIVCVCVCEWKWFCWLFTTAVQCRYESLKRMWRVGRSSNSLYTSRFQVVKVKVIKVKAELYKTCWADPSFMHQHLLQWHISHNKEVCIACWWKSYDRQISLMCVFWCSSL